MNISHYFAQILDKNKVGLPQTSADQSTFTHIMNLVFIFVGALAFLMLVIAGFRYVISQGEPAKVAEIRNQMIYAVIGLVVVASAAAIVNFVLGRL